MHTHTIISILTSSGGESVSSLCSRLLLLNAYSLPLSLSLSCFVHAVFACALCLKQRHTGALMSRLRATPTQISHQLRSSNSSDGIWGNETRDWSAVSGETAVRSKWKPRERRRRGREVQIISESVRKWEWEDCSSASTADPSPHSEADPLSEDGRTYPPLEEFSHGGDAHLQPQPFLPGVWPSGSAHASQWVLTPEVCNWKPKSSYALLDPD